MGVKIILSNDALGHAHSLPPFHHIRNIRDGESCAKGELAPARLFKPGFLLCRKKNLGIVSWENPSGMLWDFLGSSVTIWNHLTSFGFIWDYVGSPGIVWDHLVSPGIIWTHLHSCSVHLGSSSELVWDRLGSPDHLGSSGIMWHHLGSCGIMWVHLRVRSGSFEGDIWEETSEKRHSGDSRWSFEASDNSDHSTVLWKSQFSYSGIALHRIQKFHSECNMTSYS